ncbi:MAG: arsenate reductase family protein [Clostridium sp.]
MNIQIFGRKKCFDTKKVERYFKERRIKYALIDLDEKGISKGELNNVKRCVKINDLINTNAKDYKKSNLDKIRAVEMKEEILLKNPKLIKSPIVRNGKEAVLGMNEEKFKEWESEDE